MRIVANIPHSEFRITILSWNAKFLIKLEKGMLEQTYKVAEEDAENEEAVKALLTDDFLKNAHEIFLKMKQSLHDSMNAF